MINILESRFGLDDDLDDIDEIIKATDAWIEEIRNEGFKDEFDDEVEGALDDVHGGSCR